MTLVFITNFINHHQVHLADEFYKILGTGYKFIETEPIPESFIKNGYPVYERTYVVKAYESAEQSALAHRLAEESDVVIIGSAPEDFVARRIESGKLTFRYSERWFKSRPWFLTGPRGWINFYRDHIRHRDKPVYMLCASAYTAKDVNTIGAYRNKCFKWGYFTKVDNLEVDALKRCPSVSADTVNLMWCARFLKWKHPELPVKLALRLKNKGYKFCIDMFGSGEELENTKSLVKKLGVEDVVRFCGNRPNDEILVEMRKHDIFLFTSDQNEGWGAVLNEAMSCSCAVVGSDKIGSVPFLIEDGRNGMVFKSGNLNSLEKKTIKLIEDRQLRITIAHKGYDTLWDVWSPHNAAKQFVDLVRSFDGKTFTSVPASGPCSIAERI